MLLRSDARRAREDYLDIALSLPFQNDTSTAMGIVVKSYCDAATHMYKQTGYDESLWTKEEGKGIKNTTIELLEQPSPFGASVRNVRGELERGLRFWDTVRFYSAPSLVCLTKGAGDKGLSSSQSTQHGESDRSRAIPTV